MSVKQKPLSPDRIAPEVCAILNAYPDPGILLSMDYRILVANDAYKALYGDGQSLEYRHCYEVSHGNKVPCDLMGELCPMKDSLCTGEPKRVLHIHRTPRGNEHVDVETRPVRNEKGEIHYFLEIMHPVRISATKPGQQDLVGRSPVFNRMIELVKRVSDSDTSVLLLGESGTGKELVAKAIHEESGRYQKPFVPVECSSLSEALFESELFGHEKGAFTGATMQKVGLVQAAEGGTLFLDELGDIPHSLQVKLLRLLESSTYRKVGSTDAQQADFRLICATHRDIGKMVESGAFREDLFYRISPFPIELPPLRERREDIPLLVEVLLERLAGKTKPNIDREALNLLQDYRFPGNIRELKNIIERALLLVDSDCITVDVLPDIVRKTEKTGRLDNAFLGEEIMPLVDLEKQYLRKVSTQHSKNRKSLAKKLGISESTLYRKLREI